MTIDTTRQLRDAFGCFMTGVTVVTAVDETGAPLGFTANSFASVSLDPPLLLVSISNRSANLAAYTTGRGFAINVLSEAQKDISNTFARRSDDRFNGVDWSAGPYGAPILGGVSAWFGCRLERAIEAGDHTILMGAVEAFEASTEPALGYYRGTYVTPVSTALKTEHGPRVVLGAIVAHEGKVLLIDDGAGGTMLPEVRVGPAGGAAALNALLSELGVEATPGLVFAIYDDIERGLQFIVHLCPASATICRKGAFVPMTEGSMGDVTDPAQRAMLARFAAESRLGNFGQYVGNHIAGEIRPFSKG